MYAFVRLILKNASLPLSFTAWWPHSIMAFTNSREKVLMQCAFAIVLECPRWNRIGACGFRVIQLDPLSNCHDATSATNHSGVLLSVRSKHLPPNTRPRYCLSKFPSARFGSPCNVLAISFIASVPIAFATVTQPGQLSSNCCSCSVSSSACSNNRCRVSGSGKPAHTIDALTRSDQPWKLPHPDNF